MKYLALIPIVFVVSCASHPKPQIILKPVPAPAVEPVHSVRHSEMVRSYHLGRYVDPNHPETMHEQHPIYRIEASARWNVQPHLSTRPLPSVIVIQSSINDVLVAEMNRQREVTARVLSEAVRLTLAYDELQKVVGEMKSVARNNATMNGRVAEAEQRLTELRQELQKLSAQSATNAPHMVSPIDFQKP